MKLIPVASYVAGLGGLVLLGIAVFAAMARTLTYPDTRLRLTNLLRSNANQAELLCKTLPDSFIAAVGAALTAGGMVVGAPPHVVAQTTLPSYDAAATMVKMGWKMGVMGKAKLGVMASVGGLGLQISEGKWPVLLVLCALAAAGTYGWLYMQQLEAERCLVRARAELLPEVDAAIVGRRYVPPPK